MNSNNRNISGHITITEPNTSMNYSSKDPMSPTSPVYIKRSKTNNNPLALSSDSAFNNRPVARYESSNSLQNSIKSVFFGKDERFKPIDKDGKTDNFYNVKTHHSTRCAGIGYGLRKPMIVNKVGPPPGAYNIYSCFESNINHKKGAGMSSRLETEPNKRTNPGPGSYFNSSVNKSIGSSGYSLSGKNGYYLDPMIKNLTKVSPQKYKIKYDYVENGRFNKVTMGIGDKSTLQTTKTPGVGSYNLPSCFDSTKKKGYTLN